MPVPNEDARRFRARALDCRNLAKGARSLDDRAMLEDIAAELEDEARKIEAEEKGPEALASRAVAIGQKRPGMDAGG